MYIVKVNIWVIKSLGVMTSQGRPGLEQFFLNQFIPFYSVITENEQY